MIKKIIFSVFFSMLLLGVNYVYAIEHETSQFENSKKSCECVAFRLDDIQDFWLDDTQIELIKIFYEREIPLTLGVLGKNIGDDKKLNSEINRMVIQNPLFEIANHGWEHEDFTELSQEEQEKLLMQTNKKLSEIFKTTPRTFIPPFNNFNEDTIQSMKNTKMIYLSSSIVKGDKPPFPLNNVDFYRFPETATLGEYEYKMDKFVGVESDIVLEQIKQSIEDYGFAVVTMHPQEFSLYNEGVNINELNEEQVNELKTLLTEIKKSEIKFVTINQINFDFQSQKIPDWVKNVAEWWIAGEIDEQTFIESLEFLINEGIIEIE